MKKNKNIVKLIFFLNIVFLVFGLFFLSNTKIYAQSCCTSAGFWLAGCCVGSSGPCCSAVRDPCIYIPCPTCAPGEPEEPEPDPCIRCKLPACSFPTTGTANKWILKNLYSCTDKGGCSKPIKHYRTCYEIPSDQPLGSLQIYPENTSTTLGFVSDTYTGAGVKSTTVDDSVNEPIRMVATFTDTTSAEIEAMYIWFNQSGRPSFTPVYIDLNDSSKAQIRQTLSNDQFGFLMHKEGTTWKPYVPGILGDGNDAGDRWLPTQSNTDFYIYGPAGVKMVHITINSINAVSNSIVLDFNISFNNQQLSVKDGKYYIFLQGNDTFGFTPYDNYNSYTVVKNAIQKIYGNEQIRLYDNWTNSNKNWNVDLTKPIVSASTVTVVESEKTMINLNWSVDENIAIKYVIINATYLPGFLNIKPIRVVQFTGDGSITPSSIPYPYTVTEEGSSLTGSLTNEYLAKIEGDCRNGSLKIDLGDNGQGVLKFTVTVFDQGGNVGLLYDSLDFRDWIITQGGLLYSNAIDVPVRQFTASPGTWDVKEYLNRVSYEYSDISTELVGVKSDGILETPVKSLLTKAYMTRPYTVKDLNGYYPTLKGLFDRRKSSIQNLKNIDTTSLSGTLSSKYGIGSDDIGYLNKSSLTVSTDFICDGRAVFFVSGDLNIQGRVRNGDLNRDSCIFVVGGNIRIGEGIKSSTNSNATEGLIVEYDEVNAYILGDGQIDITKESSSTIYDGIYINGGLHTLRPGGLIVNRNLKLEDRLKYPVLVVDHHSKYGVLARTLFGGSLVIQKTEIGVKPY